MMEGRTSKQKQSHHCTINQGYPVAKRQYKRLNETHAIKGLVEIASELSVSLYRT